MFCEGFRDDEMISRILSGMYQNQTDGLGDGAGR